MHSRSLIEGQEMRVDIATVNKVRNIISIKNDARRTKYVDQDTEVFLIKEEF